MEYKKIRILHCVIGVLLLVLIFCFAVYEQKQIKDELKFSRESGFYEEEFYLQITGGGGTIYYTLDCSDPDENSLVYTDALLITDASMNNNVYSILSNTAIELYLGEIIGNAGYKVPQQFVDKATVIRAVEIDEKGNRGNLITKVYFVGFGDKIGYDGINIMSITTTPSKLFDKFEGIYVTGIDFDQYLAQREGVDGLDPIWSKANYRRRVQIDANVKCWNVNRELIEDSDCKISIQGGGSRAWLPKNFNIYSDSGFSKEIFHKDYGVKSLNLFAGGQDSGTKMKDFLLNSLGEDLNISSRVYVPYELFLEGEYWGTYYLTERYDKSYFKGRYGISEDNVIMLKGATGSLTAEIGGKDDLQNYEALYAFVVSNDMEEEDNYRQFQTMVDIESCVDYYATNIYIANIDWPNANYTMWKGKYADKTSCSDGKWHWCIYDVNYSMFSSYAKKDMIARCELLDPFFASLMDNDVFRQKIYQRLIYLAENCFSPEKVNDWIEDYEMKMENPMQKEYERFFEDRTIESFYTGCEDVQGFFGLRYEYIMSTYGDLNE